MAEPVTLTTRHLSSSLDAVIAAACAEAVKNLASDSPPSSEDDKLLLLPAGFNKSITRRNAFIDEAEDNIKRLEERLGLESFRNYRVTGVRTGSFLHSTTVNAERMTSISSYLALVFFVDDLWFDDTADLRNDITDVRKQNDAHDVARRWVEAFRSPEPPRHEDGHDLFYPFKKMIWEVGRDPRCLSSAHPDWYPAFVDQVEDYTFACIELRADTASAVRDVESYTRYRARNSRVVSACMLLELGNQTFLPHHVQAHPGILKLTWAATMHVAFLNDIYSYDKEVVEVGDPFNLMAVLMCAQGLSPDQALQRAVEATSSYARVFDAVEKELSEWETPAVSSMVRLYVFALKDLMSGNAHLHSSFKERYRWPSVNSTLVQASKLRLDKWHS